MKLHLVDDINRHLRQLSPHVAARESSQLLREAKDELILFRTGVNEIYRMLLAEPNAKYALDKAETALRDLMTPNQTGE
jgi:hypothetical protein